MTAQDDVYRRRAERARLRASAGMRERVASPDGPNTNYTPRSRWEGSVGGTGAQHEAWSEAVEREPGWTVEAMRWSPEAGEHEMSSWQDLFHDRRREGRRNQPR